jgi:6-phosphogluconate dehydrogenase
MRKPDHYEYELDLPEIAEIWRRGSVIDWWLSDLTAIALLDNPDLRTTETALRLGGDADYADRLLSAMRK